jgi:DNA repair ATPase RecN
MKKKECYERLGDLIQNVVLVDIEEQLDDLFEKVANDKNAKEQYNDEINDLHEMRTEFKTILEEIDNNELQSDECAELYDEILQLISEDE